MILFSISRASIDAVANHVDEVKRRVLVAIRLGMSAGIRGLAQAEVQATEDHTRTGKLEHILGRAGRVVESGDQIVAIYRPRSPDLQPHYWLQYGTKNPAVGGQLMKLSLGNQVFYRMARAGFEWPGRPFFFSTAEDYKGRFFEILRDRVNQALNA